MIIGLLAIGAETPALAGLLAALVLLGAYAVTELVANMLPDWRLPGLGNIRGAAKTAVSAAYNLVKPWLDSAANNIIGLIWYPVYFVQHVLARLYNLFSVVDQVAHYTLATAIPTAVGVVAADSAAGIDAAVARADAVYHTLETDLKTSRAIVEAWATPQLDDIRMTLSGVEGAALAAATDVYHTLEHDLITSRAIVEAWATPKIDAITSRVDGAISAAQADATAVYHAVEQDIITSRHMAESYAASVAGDLAGQYAADLQGAVAAACAAPALALTDALGDIEAVAEGGFTDVMQGVDAIPRAATGTVAGAIATALAAVVPLARLAKDCTIPNCRNLSAVGRDLSALDGAIWDGALFTLVAALVADPGNAGTAVAEVADTIIGGAVDTAKELIGVG